MKMHRNLVPLLGLVVALGALPGCDVDADDPFTGSVPDPSGVLHGAVLYAGPRPNCVYEGGTATELIGNAILLAFFDDNPPPPTGSATSAETVLIIPAREFFSLADCLPESPTPEDLQVPVTRSAAFDWPDFALANPPPPPEGEPDNRESVTTSYQIRGFMDRDGDWNPFFSVTRLATAGDIAGGAFVDTSADPLIFQPITLPSVQGAPNGAEVDGVSVALAAPVNTELPAFFLGSGTDATSSEDTVPLVTDAAMRERLIYEQTNMTLDLIDPDSESWQQTLSAAGMSIDGSPNRHAFFTLDVDANRDGVQDLHPTLGSAGVLWTHPVVILRRARNPFELAAGIPDALVIATARPSQTGTKTTFDPRIEIGVAPIAAVDTNPAAECQIPYIAPGNAQSTYERIPVECQELPTGNYDINVLSGIAGGQTINYREQLLEEMPGLPDSVLNPIVESRTENDWIIEGGTYSSQAWSIPNELGCPDPYRPNALDENGDPTTVSQVDEDPFTNCGNPAEGCDDSMTAMQCSQGPAGRFSIVDPDGSNAPDSTDTSDGRSIPGCVMAPDDMGMPATVTYMPIPSECCGPIEHLCGLPLCELRPNAAVADGPSGSRMIREMIVPGVDFERREDGTIRPLCTPFLMPASCCRNVD